MNSWPTDKNPRGRYVFSSVYILLSQDLNMIDRQTYDSLQWLGDVGGLYDGLYIIGCIFMAPLTKFSLRQELLFNVFGRRQADDDSRKRAQQRRMSNADQSSSENKIQGLASEIRADSYGS